MYFVIVRGLLWGPFGLLICDISPLDLDKVGKDQNRVLGMGNRWMVLILAAQFKIWYKKKYTDLSNSLVV